MRITIHPALLHVELTSAFTPTRRPTQGGHLVPEHVVLNIDTYCLDALNDGSYAAFGTADGRVYGSDDGGLTWLELVTGLPPVQHLLVVPD
jgi:hypothetical protein